MSEQKQPGLLELLEQWEKQGASDAEKTLWMNRYLDAKARNQGIPLHGTFELTPLCNLDCKMCYVHMSQKQLQESGKKLLTVEQWKNIMDQAIAEGMLHATLTGGEALLYPGFDELYLHLREQGIEVTVKTNGLLLTEERVEFFCQHPPAGVQISLYGADEEDYEVVTGVRAYRSVLEGIKRIHDAGITTEIVITPNRLIMDKIETMLKQLNTLGIPYGIGAGLFYPREETGRSLEELELTLDEYVELCKLQARMTDTQLLPLCEDSIPTPPSFARPAFGLRCAAGRSYFAIHWNGAMHPCVSLNSIHEDVQHTLFRDAWTSIHKRVLEYPFPRECVECGLQKLCPVCVVQHEYCGKPGHANQIFCKRARRMIEEGLVSNFK